LKAVREQLAEIDGRKKSHYSTNEIVERLLSIFFNQEKSFNTVESRENLKDNKPIVSNTLAYFLKQADLNAMNKLLYDFFHNAHRNKQLKNFCTVDDMIALVIDGTGCFESAVKHCDNCTEKKHGEKIYYSYSLLVASVVNVKTHETIVVGLEPVLKQDGVEKNDCEMNAAKRLLARIKSYNPWKRYCIIADGLYTGAPIIEQIKSYGWEAIVSLTDETREIYEVADCRFGNKKNDFFYTENLENNYLWYEEKSLSDYWMSLSIPIYVGKRVVEAIKNDGSIDSDKSLKICFFISTIPLNAANIKKINKAHRARWGIENTSINELKNRYFMKHIFVYSVTAMVWAFASLAMNLFTIFMMRNRIIPQFKKTTYETLRQHICFKFGGLNMFYNIFKLLV
jgi:ASC-1-like (ASCH) protein